MPDNIPTHIGKYKIVDELGHGGFAVVYRAFDPSVGRPVAIKILTERGPDVLTRFRNEATVAGNLRAENIVTVFEYGEHEGQPFLAMEYLEGEDLQHIINSNKPLTLLEKCNIMSQVAEGLDYAHRTGVVHRDVKPANIMVRRDGVVKIMDFGIARITRDTGATRLTQQGFMLGTLIYMAPEQFGGAEIDALSDIFAYGVVYYELLTGRHPFKAADARTLMYKISFEEPAPITDFIPDAPAGLQAVLTKILHKERELRYPNLREVESDIQPIRMELQRQRAATLLTQARELFDKKQLEPAQNVALEALTLDPSNSQCRALREQIQKQLQQRTVQPRIELLLKDGEEHLVQRRFLDAVQSFETALRLDRESVYTLSRLEHARQMFENSKAAATLVRTAREECNKRKFNDAYRSVSEALRLDPQNPGAAEVLKSVQAALEQQQKEQRVEDAIHKAEALFQAHSYDQAIALLTALGPDAEGTRVAQYMEAIRAEKQEQERKQRLQTEMAAATDLLRNHRPSEAAQRLSALKSEFAGNREFGDLLEYALREVEAEARAIAVQKSAARATALSQNNDFDGAVATLEAGLRQYPGENTLIRLLNNTLAAKADWERRQAIQAVIRECGQLRSQRRFAEAIELVEATLLEYAAEPGLVELQALLEQEWAQHRRAEAVRKAAEQARKLLAQQRPGEALPLLQQALLQYPGESELAGLLDRAQQEARAQERARAIDAVVGEASVNAKAHEFDRALTAIDQALTAWQDDPKLLRLREDLRAEKAAWDKQRAIHEALERAVQFEARKQFGEAQRAIAAVLEKYPGEQELIDAQSRIERGAEEQQRKEAARGAVSEVRLLISRGRLDEALEVLREAEQKFPGEPDLEPARRLVAEAVAARQRAEAIDRMIRQSGELAAGHQFDGACQLLERGLESYPADAELVRQLNAVRAAATAWAYEQAIQRTLAEAEALANDGRYDAALQVLETSPVCSPLFLDRAREYERREAIAKAAASVSSLLDRARTDAAIKMLGELATQYPGEPPWELLMARAQEQVAARQRAEERRRAVQDAVREADGLAGHTRFQEALDLLDRALQQYTGEAALLEGRQRIAQVQEQHRRSVAVANAARTAQSLLDQGHDDEAVRELRESCAQYPGESALASLLAQAEERLEARARRNEAVSQADTLLRQGSQAEAIELLRPHAERFPSDHELHALISRAQADLDLRRRIEAIEKAALAGLALAEDGEFDRALAALDRGLQDWPGEPRLVDARESVRSGQRAAQREAARVAAVLLLRRLGSEGRFAEGFQQAESFLHEYPGNVELLQLRNELRMRRMLADAQAGLAKGSPAEALRILEAGAADYGAVPEWVELTRRAHAEAVALARAAAIDVKCREAREKTDAGDFEAALGLLNDALAEWPADRSLEGARAATLSAQALHHRRQAIQAALTQCERLEREGRLAAAVQHAEGALHEFPDDPALLQLLERIQKDLEEQDRRRRRERDLNELRELAESVPRLSGAAQVAELLDRARRTVARHPGDPEIETTGGEAIQHLADIENAAGAIARKDFAAALEICARRLARQPDHHIFRELQEEAERGQKRAYLADLERRVSGEADLAERARVLQEGAGRYPDEQWIAAHLRLTLNKLSLLDSAIEKARACEAAGELDQALDHWKTAVTIHSRQPGLEAQIQRLQAARDRARDEARTRWAGHIEEQIQAGELGRALEMLRQALTELPDEPSFQDYLRRINALRQKARQARDLVSEAQNAAEARNFDQCRALLHQAFHLGEHDAALRKLVLNRLIESAEAALETAWQSAEALANEAVALQPGFAVPEQLLRTIAEHKRDFLVESALAKAEQFGNQANWRAGLAEVERALQEAPADTRLLQAQQALLARIEASRQSVVTELQSLAEAARSETVPAQLKALNRRASAIASEVRGDAGLSLLAAQTLREIASHEKRLRIARWKGLVAAHSRQIAGIAAGLVLAVGAGILARGFFKTFELQVITSPPGATVTVGKQTCDPSDCQFRLRGGEYEVRAELSGYRPATRKVELGGAARTPVNLVLEPLPRQASLRVKGAEPGTTISVEGGPRDTVQPDGSLTLQGIDAGTRTVEVSRPGYITRSRLMQFASGQTSALSGLDLILPRDPNTIREKEKADWERVDKSDPAAVRAFLKQYPNGSFAGEANKTLDDQAWAGVNKGDPNSIRGYLTAHARGGHADEATKLINALSAQSADQRDDTAWAAVNPRDLNSVRGYLTGYPRGRHAEQATKISSNLAAQHDADQRDDAAWAAVNPRDPNTIQRYLASYPRGRHADEATKLSTAFAAQHDADQRDDAAWGAVNPRDSAAVQRYLTAYPRGRHAEEARKLGSALAAQHDADQRDDTAWAAVNPRDSTAIQRYLTAYPHGRHADEATKLSALAAAAAEQHHKDTEDIRATLSRYVAAFRNKDADTIMDINPKMPRKGLADSFKTFRSIEMTLKPIGEPQVSGNTATVLCEQATVGVDGNGRHPFPTSTAPVTLKRKPAGGWIIDSFK